MRLTIITINFNNASGLQKTMDSVLHQTSKEFEYIVVDGASNDASKEILLKYIGGSKSGFKWISEKDSGIYEAMNKGIRMAKGDYVQFLNSGDSLVEKDVTEKMLNGIPSDCDVFYGNMIKQLPKRMLRDKGFEGRKPTMLDFYTGTLNHSSAYIKRSLFNIYGFYNESLKIVSDWKWYLQVIALNGVIPVYTNIDVSLFDMNGISTLNTSLEKVERKQVLLEILPLSVLKDYERWACSIDQIKRINRYWITRTWFYLLERVIFKLEKSLK